MNWTAFWALVRRDLKLFFKDRRAVLMTMVAPILIGSFFGYLFGGVPGSGETSRVPVALIDEDQSAASKRLASSIAGDKAIGTSAGGSRAGARAGAHGKDHGGGGRSERVRRPGSPFVLPRRE